MRTAATLIGINLGQGNLGIRYGRPPFVTPERDISAAGFQD